MKMTTTAMTTTTPTTTTTPIMTTTATKMALTNKKKKLRQQKKYCRCAWLWRNIKKYLGDADDDDDAVADDDGGSADANDSNTVLTMVMCPMSVSKGLQLSTWWLSTVTSGWRILFSLEEERSSSCWRIKIVNRRLNVSLRKFIVFVGFVFAKKWEFLPLFFLF